MRLYFKVGTMPGRYYNVCDLKETPVEGAVFNIVDKSTHGSKPFRVRLTQVRDLGDNVGNLYFVDMF